MRIEWQLGKPLEEGLFALACLLKETIVVYPFEIARMRKSIKQIIKEFSLTVIEEICHIITGTFNSEILEEILRNYFRVYLTNTIVRA